MKLQQVLNVRDMRELARRRLPRMIFDLIDGGAEDEVTMRANEPAFSRVEFRPRTLVDVSQRSVATSVVGIPIAAPFVLAPDALILAAARAAGCERVLSEDLSEGAVYDGVEVINPLTSAPA